MRVCTYFNDGRERLGFIVGADVVDAPAQFADMRAFIRAGQVRCGFPWLTIRERPELAHYRPRFAEPDRPNASLTLVRTPSGGEFDVADPALADELGPGVRVIKQDRGVFDTMPLSLLSTQKRRNVDEHRSDTRVIPAQRALVKLQCPIIAVRRALEFASYATKCAQFAKACCQSLVGIRLPLQNCLRMTQLTLRFFKPVEIG